MGFKFLHSADWHIGKTFGDFDLEQAAVLRQARLEAVTRLSEIARQNDITDVLVAGDVFDSPKPGDAVVRTLVARLAQTPFVTWHFIPGNHDPNEQEGPWSRIQHFGVPDNVVLHLKPEVSELAAGVALLPSPLQTKFSATDPTAWMDNAATADRAIRIGLAHGGVVDFDFNDETEACTISMKRAESAGLAYLALGDWHGTKEVSPRCWYSGTPEPDQFKENNPGQALIVEIMAPDAQPRITPVETKQFTWQERHQQLTVGDRLDDIGREITSYGSDAQKHLLKLVFDGQVSLSDHTELKLQCEQFEAALFVLETSFEGVNVVTEDADLKALGAGGLQDIAVRLQSRLDKETDPEASAVIKRALQKLFVASRNARHVS